MNAQLPALGNRGDVPLGEVKRLPFNRSAEFVSELESLTSLACSQSQELDASS